MATTKFRTSKFSNDIDPVVIENETDKCYYIKGRKTLKRNPRYQYHDTPKEAQNFLIKRTERTIKSLSEQLAAEKANLAKLQQLKK